MSEISEIAWLLDWLRQKYQKAPKREWRRAPASASWDIDELVAQKRHEAITDGAEIWQAIREHDVAGRWPKLSGRAAYFLCERLVAGIVWAESWLRKHNPSGDAVVPVRPSDAEAIGRQVVIEHWDTKAVDYWLEDTKADFQEKPSGDY